AAADLDHLVVRPLQGGDRPHGEGGRGACRGGHAAAGGGRAAQRDRCARVFGRARARRAGRQPLRGRAQDRGAGAERGARRHEGRSTRSRPAISESAQSRLRNAGRGRTPCDSRRSRRLARRGSGQEGRRGRRRVRGRPRKQGLRYVAVKFRDYYEVLGVPRTATGDEIKQAYRKLARKRHPDLQPASERANASEAFKEINEAYEVLGDPEKRAKYDAIGQGWRNGQDFTPPPGTEWRTGGGRGGESVEWEDLGGFSDFFASIFGRGETR